MNARTIALVLAVAAAAWWVLAPRGAAPTPVVPVVPSPAPAPRYAVVVVTSPGCEPCERMKREVAAGPADLKGVQVEFRDAATLPVLARRRVRSTPTVFRGSLAGARHEGYLSPTALAAFAVGGAGDLDLIEASVGGPRSPGGAEIQFDLPPEFHQKNTGGSDGAGLCVFASMRHSGLWANEPVFTGLFEWMKRRPGGSYPTKTDQMIRAYASEKGLALPQYLQVQDADLNVLREACKAGLMPGVTYWRSPTGRYGGQRISHMVSLVHADDRHFAILDNNYITPAGEAYEWMSPEEFLKTYTGGTGRGWAVIPLKAGPPPVPHNGAPAPAPVLPGPLAPPAPPLTPTPRPRP